MYVCVCVCVCERLREIERKRERKKMRDCSLRGVVECCILHYHHLICTLLNKARHIIPRFGKERRRSIQFTVQAIICSYSLCNATNRFHPSSKVGFNSTYSFDDSGEIAISNNLITTRTPQLQLYMLTV